MNPDTSHCFTIATQPFVAFRSVETNPPWLSLQWLSVHSVTVAALLFALGPLCPIFASFLRGRFVSPHQSLDGCPQS